MTLTYLFHSIIQPQFNLSAVKLGIPRTAVYGTQNLTDPTFVQTRLFLPVTPDIERSEVEAPSSNIYRGRAIEQALSPGGRGGITRHFFPFRGMRG